MRLARSTFSILMLAGLVVISRAGASGRGGAMIPMNGSSSNANYGMLSQAPGLPLSASAMYSLQPGYTAASKIMNFQPQVPKFQMMTGLAHSEVNNGVWNGVGQLPNPFPWSIQYPDASTLFDWRINTSYYSDALGPLTQSTDGSTLPWEMGLAPDVAAVYTKQGLKTANVGSAPQMNATLVQVQIPDLKSASAR